MGNPTLSVCFGIQNRFSYEHNGVRYPLFERTFPHLLEACKQYKNINICMVDMNSDDVDLYHWSNGWCNNYGIPLYYIKAQRRPIYNIGFTKNLAAQLTTSEYLAFIDVDMLIPKGFFEKGIDILKTHKCAWFPIYDREHSPNGKTFKGNGRGNAMVTRQAWAETKWAELDKWGGEDCIFCNRLISKGYEQNRDSIADFLHLWHPMSNEKSHKEDK